MNRLFRGIVIISNQAVNQYLRGLSSSVAGNRAIPRNMGPVEERIRRKLTDILQPSHLDVINESSMHNVPKGSETHFKVVVVSEKFETVPLIQRHRLINNTLKDELASGVHALSIVAHSPGQWEQKGGQVEKSPPCLGGSKR